MWPVTARRHNELIRKSKMEWESGAHQTGCPPSGIFVVVWAN
jgi:hypothetical protein